TYLNLVLSYVRRGREHVVVQLVIQIHQSNLPAQDAVVSLPDSLGGTDEGVANMTALILDANRASRIATVEVYLQSLLGHASVAFAKALYVHERRGRLSDRWHCHQRDDDRTEKSEHMFLSNDVLHCSMRSR